MSISKYKNEHIQILHNAPPGLYPSSLYVPPYMPKSKDMQTSEGH